MNDITIIQSIGEFLYTLVDFIVFQFSWLGQDFGTILTIGIGMVIILRALGR